MKKLKKWYEETTGENVEEIHEVSNLDEKYYMPIEDMSLEEIAEHYRFERIDNRLFGVFTFREVLMDVDDYKEPFIACCAEVW